MSDIINLQRSSIKGVPPPDISYTTKDIHKTRDENSNHKTYEHTDVKEYVIRAKHYLAEQPKTDEEKMPLFITLSCTSSDVYWSTGQPSL